MLFSIIIPTMNERDNVRRVAERIREVFGLPESASASPLFEVWFVDDSRDDTPRVLDELATQYSFVHYVHRPAGTGLASAVVEGFQRCRGEWIAVMDADLQHPPEVLPRLLQHLQAGADVVIPSRFVPGGSDGGLNLLRKCVSWTARTLARLAIRRLRPVADCTSGFFGLHRSVLDGVPLYPIGWKILMEILVRGRYRTVQEIPYAFVARDAGASKMSLREQWNYLRHIARLVRDSPEDRRFYLYCLVGGFGTVVNLSVMTALVAYLHLRGVTASLVASAAAMLHNFFWNDRLTWRERGHPPGWHRALQIPLFLAVSGVSMALTALAVQVSLWLHGGAVTGQLAGIAAATVWSFQANNRWTWREAGEAAQPVRTPRQETQQP
ncbi:MAG: glycosyltransferase family 2 protein [Alicyclobacillus sp.]|nr:glycosyltransferase family 2 protein [Alicyclobacillus sp.]